jgi:putative molybdopterin biosynthesis protein
VDRAPNRVRARREARGLSQIALAERASLTRQSIGAIEAGRTMPAVDVALRIARALECRVEDLFAAPGAETLTTEHEPESAGARAVVAHVGGRWVSHALPPDAMHTAADAIVTAGERGLAHAETLRPEAELRENVVVMGCASGLGILCDRLSSRSGPGRFVWVPRSSTAALSALAARRAHLAGVHLVDDRTGEANVADVRRARAGEAVVLITLARWDAGLVVRSGDRRPVRSAADLARKGLRIAAREAGAGAQRLLERVLREQRLPAELAGRPSVFAAGHLDVARAIAMGAADVGVATRDAALAFGLGFVPLAEERYDLALPKSGLADPRIERLLDVLVSGALRRELGAIGYDVRPTGERAAEVDAA